MPHTYLANTSRIPHIRASPITRPYPSDTLHAHDANHAGAPPVRGTIQSGCGLWSQPYCERCP
eukprot:4205555-Lingulodinium_polyedra.AAC.1